MSYSDRALICDKGHVIAAHVSSWKSDRQNFCSRCGARTITECPQCSAGIHLDRLNARYVGLGIARPPAFCPHCGSPYPWTANALVAAKSLTNEVEGLTPEDRQTLSTSIDDLVSEGPQADLAATRFRLISAKLGNQAVTAFRDILVNVVSESIKKAIWGQ